MACFTFSCWRLTSAHGPQLAWVRIQLGLLEVSMQLKATGSGGCGIMQIEAFRP